MKLKRLWNAIYLLSAFTLSGNTWAANENIGLHYITARGEVRCGTDLSSKTFAFKDDGGDWRGIDADICRMFSLAVFGESSHFKLVNVPTNQISQALGTNLVDIMLGNNNLPAEYELQSRANAADVLYYDRHMLLAAEKPRTKSMEAFRTKNVCVVRASEDVANLKEYNRRYNLELKILPFPSAATAKEAFYLKRCELLSGNESYLRGLAKSVVSRNVKPVLLPEVIAQRPVYAYVDSHNNKLRIISKWVLNAPRLAEAGEINSRNVKVFIGNNDTSTRNLLGDDAALWKMFGLQPDWVRKSVAELGNYGEMFERNLGSESELKIERDKNKLIQNEGLMPALQFL